VLGGGSGGSERRWEWRTRGCEGAMLNTAARWPIGE
jgi:hypothetical protein